MRSLKLLLWVTPIIIHLIRCVNSHQFHPCEYRFSILAAADTTVKESGITYAEITWRLPYSQQNVTGYRLDYSDAFIDIYDANTSEYVLENLHFWQEYRICVLTAKGNDTFVVGYHSCADFETKYENFNYYAIGALGSFAVIIIALVVTQTAMLKCAPADETSYERRRDGSTVSITPPHQPVSTQKLRIKSLLKQSQVAPLPIDGIYTSQTQTSENVDTGLESSHATEEVATFTDVNEYGGKLSPMDTFISHAAKITPLAYQAARDIEEPVKKVSFSQDIGNSDSEDIISGLSDISTMVNTPSPVQEPFQVPATTMTSEIAQPLPKGSETRNAGKSKMDSGVLPWERYKRQNKAESETGPTEMSNTNFYDSRLYDDW